MLGKMGLHPNHVTLIGTALFGVAAWFVSDSKWLYAVIAGFIGSLMDGVDGVLARETGKKSTFGAILDSSCDRITEILLLLGILIYYLNSIPPNKTGVILCFAGLSGSIMVSYIKARCEGVNVPCKSGILQRPERLILLLLGLLLGPRLMIWILSFLTIFSWFTVAQRLFEASRYGEKKDV
jgi:CDP-diacylglycerol--glycerol-3-phosphate 3-phosphatidyltransferase